DFLARGDNRFTGEERGTDVIDRGLLAGDGFDDDVDIAGEEIVEALGPGELGERLRLAGALVAGASVGDMRQFDVREGIGAGEAPGDGRADRAKTENADATADVAIAGAIARCVERVQRHPRPLYQTHKN